MSNEPTAAGDGAARPKIMVVNDTQEILDLFDVLLSDEGYDTFLYSYALRDLDEVERVNPDLVVLDLMMGGENQGWQFLQKLRMNRETAGIPVVVCTAATQVVRETEGFLKAKDVDLVPKPFDIDDLLSVVQRALARGRRERVDSVDVRAPADDSKQTGSQ